MNISRELALEIFGLQDDFSREDLIKSYRNLVRLAYPDNHGDNTLTVFINECKKVLEDSLPTINTSNQIVKTANPQETAIRSKPQYYITLKDLYAEYYFLDEIRNNFKISRIYAKAKVYVYPCFKNSMQESFKLYPSALFKDFLDYNRVDFAETITLPKEFRKYKAFKVKVVFMNTTYNFIIFKNSIKRIFFSSDEFNTYLRLRFKFAK